MKRPKTRLSAAWGGDEFLVACLSKAENQADEGQINLLRARLRDRIAGQYGLGSVSIVYPGASLGVVEVDPAGMDPDSALRVADVAMYQDKKGKGKTRFHVLD